MSDRSSGPPTIPARLTVAQLAEAIERPIEQVRAVLTARQEPSGDGDLIGGDLAIAVGNALGSRVVIEPRDVALEILYGMEAGGDAGIDTVPPRAKAIVEGVSRSLDGLDAEIESASEHWSVARMPAIDRAILRIGLYELRNDPGTPTAVIVTEAVRLAKAYSTERSGSFVNGVLAALARRIRP